MFTSFVAALTWEALQANLGILGLLVGGIGYLAGIFRGNRNKAQRDADELRLSALEAALGEAQVWRQKSERLDEEIAELKRLNEQIRTERDQAIRDRDVYRSLVMMTTVPDALARKFDDIMAAIKALPH